MALNSGMTGYVTLSEHVEDQKQMVKLRRQQLRLAWWRTMLMIVLVIILGSFVGFVLIKINNVDKYFAEIGQDIKTVKNNAESVGEFISELGVKIDENNIINQTSYILNNLINNMNQLNSTYIMNSIEFVKYNLDEMLYDLNKIAKYIPLENEKI